MSPEEQAIYNAGQRSLAWSTILNDYPDAHLASDGAGRYVLVDEGGALLGHVAVYPGSVDFNLQNGGAFSVGPDGKYSAAQIDATGQSNATLFEPNGTEIGPAPVTGAQTLSSALLGIGDFYNLVTAIQTGQPLPVAVAGARLIANQVPTNLALGGVATAGSAVLSVLSLENAIQRGDAIGALYASAQAVQFGAQAYSDFAFNSLGDVDESLVNAATESGAIDALGTAQNLGAALPYLSLVNDLSQQNYVGAAIDTAVIVNAVANLALDFIPVVGWLYAFYNLIKPEAEPPKPWGVGSFVWNADGSIGTSVAGDNHGDIMVAGVLASVQSALTTLVANFQAANPATTIGLIANRLPSLSLDGASYALHDSDPISGLDRTIHYDLQGHAQDAALGSPEYFRPLAEEFVYSALGRQAIAPQWEVDTARLQSLVGEPFAGQTDVQRAAHDGQLAPLLAAAATTQSFRPVILDLNGDGVRTVSKDQSHVAFDVDHSGYVKNTGWVDRADGLLVLDRNDNGTVDDGSELFSNALVVRGRGACLR